MRRPTAWARANRSALALVLVLAALTGLNLLYTAHAVSDSNHQWCSVVTAITARPVPKPANPKVNPSRAVNYEWYLRFVTLKRGLGC